MDLINTLINLCIIITVATLAQDSCNTSTVLPLVDEYTIGNCRVSVQQISISDNGIPFKIAITDTSTTVPGPSGCELKKPDDPEYVEFPGYGYYKYHSTPKTWYEAWDTCKSEGGHLSVFNSEEEAKFVGAIPQEVYDWAFIGFHDMYKEGYYVTIFDQTLEEAGWATWEQSNPNGGTGENCGVTFASGELGDYVCSNPRTFFCEISCQVINQWHGQNISWVGDHDKEINKTVYTFREFVWRNVTEI